MAVIVSNSVRDAAVSRQEKESESESEREREREREREGEKSLGELCS